VVTTPPKESGGATLAVQWERGEVVPHLRLEGATAVLGDTVYLLGGVGPGDTLSAIRTVDRFDQRGRRWSLGPALPRAVSHIQAAVVGDSTIWIAGGFLGRHGGPPTAEVWRLDRRLGQWVAGPSLPEARGGGALVAIGDTLFYAGGWGEDRATDRAEVWQLLPRARAWRVRAALPIPRGDAAAVTHAGRLLLIGGQQGHDRAPVDLADAWAYDPRTDRWSERAAMPATRSHMTSATVRWGDWVLVAGGGNIGAGRRFSDDILGYHAQHNVWRRLPALPVPLRGANAWLRGDTLQVAGGAQVNNAPSNRYRWSRSLRKVWMLLPGNGPAVPMPVVAVAGDELFLFGNRRRATWHYHLPSGTWGPEDELPYRPRQGEVWTAAADDTRLEVLGGTPLGDSASVVQTFDLARRQWSTVALIPPRLSNPQLLRAAGTTWLHIPPARARRGQPPETATPGVVYRSVAGQQWDSIAVVPERYPQSVAATDGRILCVVGGVAGQREWGREIQCLDLATRRWRTSAAGELDTIPGHLGFPRLAAFVNGRLVTFGWSGYAFDFGRNAWDSLPWTPIEADRGVLTTDGDRLLHYSTATGKVWMMWP
jgi:N-acetylneuraminic acid mutarotase